MPDDTHLDAECRAVSETALALPDARRGKVRDTYTLPGGAPDGSDAILMVASDRLSAFDVVLPNPIPGKGRLLTEIAAFWLRKIESEGICRTHLIGTDAGVVPDHALTDTTRREDLVGRVTIGRRCRVVPVECVVRGYLEGSGWADYQRTGSVCGVALPTGLRQCEQLPEPVFTPATKAETGHDENIGFDSACAHADGLFPGWSGRALMEYLRDRSMAIYKMASRYAASRGIILADTKFEFGIPLEGGDPILIDEALTPDSSRFWRGESYEAGRAQQSFDKQFIREYLQSLVDGGSWDKTPPGPELPDEVIAGTIARYREAARLLTT